MKYTKVYIFELDSSELRPITVGHIFNSTNEINTCHSDLHGEYWSFLKFPDETFLVRDKIGIMPCYFHLNSNKLFVSSHLQNLIETLKSNQIKLTYNKNYAFQLYQKKFNNQQDTIINEIHRCPPASKIIFSKNEKWSCKARKYWSPQLDKNIYNKNFYSQSLQSILQNCIQDRLQSSRKIGLFLSGGLDSSLLYEFLKKDEFSNWKAYAIDFEPDSLAYEKNLSLHIENINKMFWSKEFMVGCLGNHKIWPKSTLYSPGLGIFLPLFEKAHKDKVDTIWTGLGGDDFFSSPELYDSKNYLYKFLFYLKAHLKGIQGDLFQKMLRSRIEFSGNYSYGIECEQQLALEFGQLMSYPLMDDRIYTWILLDYSLGIDSNKSLLRKSFSEYLPYEISAYRSKQDLKEIHQELLLKSNFEMTDSAFSYEERDAIISPYLKKMKEYLDEKSH